VGQGGRVIKIVSSVGFVDLHQVAKESEVQRYQAEIGNGRILDIEFSQLP
jgi:hypothetical protein